MAKALFSLITIISLPHLLTHSLTYSLTPSLTHSLPHLLTHSLTYLLTPSLTYSLPHSPIHKMTPLPLTTTLLPLLILLSTLLPSTQPQNCTSVITSAITLLTTIQPGVSKSVTFQLTTMKSPAKFTSYSTGQMRIAYYNIRRGQFAFPEAYLTAKNTPAYFSDRTWCPEQIADQNSLCFGYQPFDYRKIDRIEVSLFANSTGRLVLNTWGNATLRVQLKCQDGFLYGSLKETSGNSWYTVSLKTDSYVVPK